MKTKPVAKGRVRGETLTIGSKSGLHVEVFDKEADEQPSFDVSDVADAVIAALDDGGGNDRWQVRVFQRDGADEFQLFDCRPDEIDDLPNRVRETYGTGKFRVIVRRNGAIFRKKEFATKAPPGWRAPQPQAEVKQNDLASLVTVFAEMQKRSDERFAELIRELRTSQAAQQGAALPSSPFDLADKMMSTMKSMMETMGGAKSESMFDAVMKGVELRDKLAGQGDGGGSNFYDLIRDGMSQLPAIADIVKNLPKGAPPALAGNPPPRQLPARAPAPQQQQQVDAFGAQVQMLVDRAKAGKNPEAYAAMMAEELPPEWLVGLLQQSDPVAVFASLNPDVNGQREWFGELVDILREIVQGDGALPAGEGDTSLADGNGTEASPASSVGDTGRREGGSGNP